MTNIKVLNEFEIKEIAYQTCYLMMHGWKRYNVTYDLLEKERPDLPYEEKDHVWMKEITEFVGAGLECHEISYYNGTKISSYFTLSEAYHRQLKKSLLESKSSAVMD